MSDSLYSPDGSVVPVPPWSEAFRVRAMSDMMLCLGSTFARDGGVLIGPVQTQRDVALRVPINYLTVTATSLRAACFANNQYEDAAFQKCFSNLLATGFRGFVVDVYWDPGRSAWSLCPAELPSRHTDFQRVSPTVAPSLVQQYTTTKIPVGRRGVLASWEVVLATLSPFDGLLNLMPRQDNPNLEAVSSRTSTGPAVPAKATTGSSNTKSSVTTSTTSAPHFRAFPTDPDNPLIEIGSYNCTSSMTLDYLTGIIEDYLDDTETTTQASLGYLFLNVHAAASSEPDAPAQQISSAQMPTGGNFLSNVIKGNLSDLLYTPKELQSDRNDLNSSWLEVNADSLPWPGYYETSLDSNKRLTTPNGWPTEAYMEFKQFYRLIASFGAIDPQMAGYNITRDEDTIFPAGTIRLVHNTTFDASGAITSGCFFSASETTITTSTNNSWTMSPSPQLSLGLSPDTTAPIPAIANLTACGISPWLNNTLSNVTADQDVTPYRAFAYSTLWTWAPGEPANTTAGQGSSTRNRCAAIYMTGPYAGRWKATDCNSKHRVACQSNQSPYEWHVSESTATYFTAESACPRSLRFSVPHTTLENAHLLAAMHSASTSSGPQALDPSDPVFVNLNSLNVRGCWVTEVNATCPYVPPNDTNKTRVVVVPTVAAVIIFVLAALTFFVKCAANRREEKRGRRRRTVGGWDYEGVPS